MPDLLHEFWRSDERGEFGKVSEIGDKERDRDPGLNFMFEVWAPSWSEALRLYDELAYGEFGKYYDHFPNTIYSVKDRREQEAYLPKRPNVR